MPTPRKTADPAPEAEPAAEPLPPEPVDPIAAYRARCPFPEPVSVREAIANVLATIGGVEKLTPAERRQRTGRPQPTGEDRGVTYAYRSIDDVAAAAQRLLGLNGIVVLGSVDRKTASIETVTVNSKPWTHVVADVTWSILGPGETSINGIVTVGEGRDNSDKVWNKVQTVARKNLLLMLLQIGDPTMDPDTERYETDAAPAPEREWVKIDRLLHDAAGGEDGPVVAFKALTATLGRISGDIRQYDDDDPALLVARAWAMKIANRYRAWVDAGHDPEETAKAIYTRIAKDGEAPDEVLGEEPPVVEETAEPVPALVRAAERAADPVEPAPVDETDAVREALDAAWAAEEERLMAPDTEPADVDLILDAAATALFRDGTIATMTEARAAVEAEQAAQDAADEAQRQADLDRDGSGY